MLTMGYNDGFDDAGIEEQTKLIEHDKTILLDCFSYYQVATVLVGADINAEILKNLQD